MKKKRLLQGIGIFLGATGILTALLYFHHDIGISSSKLEDAVRSSPKIQDSWQIKGNVSENMAAFIAYPEDRSSHSFSIYVNRPGFSWGYFFRIGGSLGSGITAFLLEDSQERALVSMNQNQAAWMEIENGNSIQKISLDEFSPFAFVFPVNMGSITFYDKFGNEITYTERRL